MKYYFSNKPDSLSSGGLNPNVNSDKFQTNWNVLLNYLSPEIESGKTNSSSSSIISQQNLNNQDEQETRTIDLVGLANSTMPSGMLIYTSTSAVTTKEWLSWSSSSSCESFETTGTDLNPSSSIESDSNGENIKVKSLDMFLDHIAYI